MADIQYLNYGDQQIEQQALLNNLADNVQSYVAGQSWSNKRKEKFMSAYSDIMNKGLQGASNSSGQWKVIVNGNINFDEKDKKDKEMYQEAAYFIQQQMSELLDVSNQKKEEEQKQESKEKLPLFDNKSFINSLIKHISTSDYGGQNFHIGGEEDMWNKLDKRDSNGIIGRQNRTNKLIEYLESYGKNFDDNKYNFEGGPFGNANEFRSRLNAAIEALKNKTNTNEQDDEALNRLGLNPEVWFYNGSRDLITDENGNQMLYTQKAQLEQERLRQEQQALEEEQKKKKEEEQKKRKETIQKYRENLNKYKSLHTYKYDPLKIYDVGNLYSSNIQSIDDLLAYVKNNYSNVQNVNDFSKHINKIQGSYKILNENNKLEEISDETFNILLRAKSFADDKTRGSQKNNFKQVKGIDNIVFDTTTNKIYYLDINKIKQLDPLQKYGELKKKGYPAVPYFQSYPTHLIYNKQGGRIDKQKIQKYKEFINK